MTGIWREDEGRVEKDWKYEVSKEGKKGGFTKAMGARKATSPELFVSVHEPLA